MPLYDNITIEAIVYENHYRYYDRKLKRSINLPNSKPYTYVLTKLWNKDEGRAKYLYELLVKLHRYDKVKLHKGCVYASRRTH